MHGDVRAMGRHFFGVKMQNSGLDIPLDVAFRLAVEQHQAGRLEDAEARYRAVLQAQPQHPDANHNLGVLAMQLDQPQAGLPFLINALEANADNSQHWLSLLECLVRLEVWGEAADLLDKAEVRGLNPLAVAEYRSKIEAGRGIAADADLLKTLRSLAGRSSQRPHSAGKQRSHANLLKDVMVFFRAGDWKNMEIAALSALKLRSEQGKLWHLLGVACLQQEKLQAALIALDKACALQPKDAEVWDHKGVVLNRLGEYAKAEESYRRSLTIGSGRPEAWGNAGINAIDAGCFVDAAHYLQRALELQPDFVQAHNDMGNVQKLLGHPERAMVHYQRALELKPDFVEALNNLGCVQQELNQLEAAVASYQRALQLKPDYAEAFGNLGFAMYELDRREDAIACYQHALALKPDLAEVHGNLGNALQEMGQLEAAADSYDRALVLKPNAAETLCSLGRALLNQGKTDEAAAAILQGVSLAPADPGCIIARLRLLYAQGSFAEVDRYLDEIIESALAAGRLNAGLVNECLTPALSSVNRRELLAARLARISSLPDGTERRNGMLATYAMLSAWMDGDDEVFGRLAREHAGFLTLPDISVDKNLRRFAIYLQSLLRYKAQHAAQYSGMSTAVLNVIGDSHCLSPANAVFDWQGQQVRGQSYLALGVKMHHLAWPGINQKRYVADFLQAVDGKAPILLTIGEIDCRPDEGIWKAWRVGTTPLEDIIAGTVDGYLGWLDTQFAEVAHGAVIVQGIPAPGYALTGEKDPVDVPGFLAMIRAVNVRLKSGVTARGWYFLDVYAATVNESGVGNGQWHLDQFHLQPGFYAQAQRWLCSGNVA